MPKFPINPASSVSTAMLYLGQETIIKDIITFGINKGIGYHKDIQHYKRSIKSDLGNKSVCNTQKNNLEKIRTLYNFNIIYN